MCASLVPSIPVAIHTRRRHKATTAELFNSGSSHPNAKLANHLCFFFIVFHATCLAGFKVAATSASGFSQVRESKEQIDRPLVQHALDQLELGLPSKPLPNSPAKMPDHFHDLLLLLRPHRNRDHITCIIPHLLLFTKRFKRVRNRLIIC